MNVQKCGYHEDYSSLSCTMLKLFRKSRVEFNLTYNTRELATWRPNAPAQFGMVMHAILLEDAALEDLVLRYPADVLNKNGGLIGARASEFREANGDKIYMKDDEFDGIEAATAAVLSHPDLAAMMESAKAGHREQRFDADLFGLPCKCKPDIACDMGSYMLIYDLKFSLNVDPDSWRRTSRRLCYWLQDSHYSAVLQAAFNKPVVFRFCNIETKPPFRAQWYFYDQRSREIAADEHKRLILDLKRCKETGDWSDGWESECTLNTWDIEAELSPDEVEISE